MQSNTLMVLSVTADEAIVESFEDSFCPLTHIGNVYYNETAEGDFDESTFVDIDEDVNKSWKEEEAEKRKEKKQKAKGKTKVL